MNVLLDILAGAILISVIVSVGLGFVVYLFISRLGTKERTGVIAAFVVIGFVLIITVVGADIGTVTILTGAFAEVFNLLRPASGGEPEA